MSEQCSVYCREAMTFIDKDVNEYGLLEYKRLCELIKIFDRPVRRECRDEIAIMLHKKQIEVNASEVLELSEESDNCPITPIVEERLPRLHLASVNIKKLRETAIIPTYATEFSAGADLHACMIKPSIQIKSGDTHMIGTGLAIEIPVGMVGLIYARSGLACKDGLAPANKVGVIDSDYRGEIIVALHNHSTHDIEVYDGDRIAQFVITPYIYANFTEVDHLDYSERGNGGFGSTGK